MSSFWNGFLKAAEDNSTGPATIAGAVGAVGAAKGFIDSRAVAKKHQQAVSAKNWKDFANKLKPGDILASTPIKSSDRAIKQIPITLKDSLTYFGESPQTHSSLYLGKGKLFEIAGSEYKASQSDAKVQLSRGENVIAYRPTTKGGKPLSTEETRKAIARAKSLSGAKYETSMDTAKRVARMATGTGGKSCSIGKGGRIVCTDVIAKAYPKHIPDRHTALGKIERSKQMQPVASLIRKMPTARTKFIHNVLRPAVRGAKWALPAYGAAKAIEYVKGKKNEPL